MTDLVDGVSVREDVVRPELKAAVDWSLQQLLVRIRRRPKLENPLLYLSKKLSEYSNNFRDAIDDEEREKVKGILGRFFGHFAIAKASGWKIFFIA